MASPYRIVRYRGDTYPLYVNLTENRKALDLDGLDVILTIKYKKPLIIFGQVVGDDEDGKVRFDFDAEAVRFSGEFKYDIVVNDEYYQTTFIKDIIEFTDDINKVQHDGYK